MAALPDRKGTLASFALVSVVRIASANCRRCSTEAPAPPSSGSRRDVIFVAGKGTPIMPVDDGKTSEGLVFSKCANSEQINLQARNPDGPVAQFAFPELTMTARTRPFVLPSEARSTSTGAATMRFFVNRAAAVARDSVTISARSGFLLDFIPAAMAEKVKPLGRKIGPEPLISGASPENSQVQAGWRISVVHL